MSLSNFAGGAGVISNQSLPPVSNIDIARKTNTLNQIYSNSKVVQQDAGIKSRTKVNTNLRTTINDRLTNKM